MMYQCSPCTLAPDRRDNHQGASDARADLPLLLAARVARAQSGDLARHAVAAAQPEAPPHHFASLAALYAFLGNLAGETKGMTDEPNDADCTSSQTH